MTAVFSVLLLTSTDFGEKEISDNEERTKYDMFGKEIIHMSSSSAKSSVLDEGQFSVGGVEATMK